MTSASATYPGKRPTSVVLLCAVLALSACTTLGPDYQTPEVNWIDNWQTSLYGQADTPQQQAVSDLRFWWTLFDDPALNRLIEQVREANPSLRIAGLRILESRAQLGIARSNLYPQSQQLGGSVDYVSTRRRGGDLPNNDDSFVGYQSGFNLAWELDFWGRFKRGIESADAAFFASIANQRNLQVLLSAQVAELYFAYRTTVLRIRIARENADIQKRSYEITEKIYKSGQQGELDLQQARTQYLSTLSTIPELEITLTKTRNALATLLARPPGELAELNGAADSLPMVKPLVIQAIPARLLIRRPDISAAAWQVAAQSAQIGIAEADFYPSIALFGSIGLSGDTRSSSADIGTLSIGPGVNWNIFDHGRIANNVRVQDARLQQLIEQYQDTVLQAAREIDDAAISVVKSAERQRVLSESVAAARRSLELANKRYREGYADFQRVLDAQRAMFTQAENELVNQGSHVGSVISLYKALGGGWFDTPVKQLIPVQTRDTMEQRSDWGNLLDSPLPDDRLNPSTVSGAQTHE